MRRHPRAAWISAGLLVGLAVTAVVLLLMQPKVTWAVGPTFTGRIVQQLVQLRGAGELFAFVEVATDTADQDPTRIPLRILEQAAVTQPDGQEVTHVIAEMPTEIDLEALRQLDRQVRATLVPPDQIAEQEQLFEAQRRWISDRLNDAALGVPLSVAKRMSGATRGTGSGATDLLGLDWPSAALLEKP